jgi:hypothetical protein
MVLGLPFEEVWAVDFEFTAHDGDLPGPVCMVAEELGSGRIIRLWQDELPIDPPFRVDAGVLFVAYLASAELGCFLQLGWPMPERVLDLYVEFRAATNGLSLPDGRSLLGALSYHHLPRITSDEKTAMRSLVLRGGPWTDDERKAILDYCETDVTPMGALLERMLPRITATPKGLGHALLRGRYMAAVAWMERVGIPVDIDTLEEIREAWPRMKARLIEAVDKDYGVYEGTTFKAGLFAAWVRERGIDWPKTATGQLQLDQDTFRDMAKAHPELAPLRELRHALSELRLEKIAVGADYRNRTLLGAFGASSGRNTPSTTKSIMGPSVWLRHLIMPGPRQAIAYVDWKSQEVWIAAVLSGDERLLAALQSGDPYLAFAVLAGMAPADATKESHPQVREACKTTVLGVQYGMGAQTMASRLGVSVLDAEHLLRAMATAFPTFTRWAEHVIDVGTLTGRLATVFGWPVHVTGTTRPTTLRNFPMQANGAEMLRLACMLATERGVFVCAPVHDALLIEAAVDEIDDAVEVTRYAMAEASRAVLRGIEIPTDVQVIKYPDRYSDPRGTVMWDRVTELLSEP